MGDAATVKVSAKMARQLFHGCTPAYIRDVCHAACCFSSGSPTGTLIAIHPREKRAVEARGGEVENGLLKPREGEKRCPFMESGNLCGLHGTSAKPFGCVASPFTLNANDTLIVRNRYRLLKCYRDRGPEDKAPMPAYRAFRASLDRIFGVAEARRVCEHLDAGGGDVLAQVPRGIYDMLRENDRTKRGTSQRQSADQETLWSRC